MLPSFWCPAIRSLLSDRVVVKLTCLVQSTHRWSTMVNYLNKHNHIFTALVCPQPHSLVNFCLTVHIFFTKFDEACGWWHYETNYLNLHQSLQYFQTPCENSPFVQFVNTLQMLSSCILRILQFESLQLILNTAQMACMSFDSQLVLLKFRLRTGQYVDFWSDVFIVMTNMKANSMVGI